LVARGASWNIIGQLTPTVVTIFLTPYILHGLGVIRYGLFVLTGSLAGFLSTFDGGIRGTAQRYFGVYAGQNDVRRTTQLMVTLLLLISAFGVVLSAVGWLLAPPIVSLLRMPANLRPESVFLFRTLGMLVTFGFLHNIFVGLLQSRHRFAYITKAGFAVYAIWTGGLILTVHYGWGLRGIALVFIAQQVFLAATIVPASLAYVRRADVGLLPRSEAREMVSFATRIQISNLSLLVTTEFNAILIGAALSVRTVSFYNSGSNFAQNVAGLTMNGLAPIQTALTNTFGEHGNTRTFDLFRRLERVWVVGLTGLFATSGAAAWFAITAWLGPQFGLGGQIAIVALLGQLFYSYTGVLRTYCTVIGRPGLESRFGVFGVLVNLVLVVPLVFTGAIGVIAATAAGQFLGAFYLIHSVRKSVAPDLPYLFRSIPYIPGVVAICVVVAVELAMRPIVPGGGLGLIISGLPVLFGLLVFAVSALGPRAAWDVLRAGVARARGRSFTLPKLDLLNGP
jgi:O-antigen/teichoic acid export membrane protein